jgi:hypothetical protein
MTQVVDQARATNRAGTKVRNIRKSLSRHFVNAPRDFSAGMAAIVTLRPGKPAPFVKYPKLRKPHSSPCRGAIGIDLP